MSHDKLQDTIELYADAYDRLERLQDQLPWIPSGDQKTGCIGEYYAYVYLLSRHDDEKISFGNHSQKGWDIKVEESVPQYIQVKTISEFSETRTMSPIHKGWSQLFIIYLNKSLEPEGFWVITDNSIVGPANPIKGKRCKEPGNDNTGSHAIPFGPNRCNELTDAIELL
jgi:hypothetical protein